MAFRTPVDYGFAQVIDNSGLVNAYAQQQMQRNKEAQLQQKEVADQLAKINTNGIKEADIPHINDKFDRLRDIGNQAKLAAGTSQALQKQAEFDKAAREMSYDIEQSKASNQLYQDRLKFKGEHHPDELDPDYDTRLSAIKDISTFSPDYKVVTNDVDKLYNRRPTVDLMKDVFSPIVEKSYTTNTEETKVGNRFVKERMKSASPEFIANNIAAAMLSNPHVSTKIMDTYYDGYTQTDPSHDKAEATQRGFNNYDPTKFKDYVALQALRLARPKQIDESSKGDGKQIININTGQPNEFGNPVGSGGKDINTTVYGTDGKPRVAQSTVEESYTYPQIKGRVAKATNIKSSTTGESVKDAGDLNVNGGETVLGLVYKNGTKGTSGKDLSGLLVPNDHKDREKRLGNAEYGTVFRFRGTDKDGVEDDYYMPAKDALANIASLAPSKDDAASIKATITNLEALKAQKNQLLQVNTKKVVKPTSSGGVVASNKSYKAPDGKSYSTASLKKLGYTDEQIQAAVKGGKLK